MRVNIVPLKGKRRPHFVKGAKKTQPEEKFKRTLKAEQQWGGWGKEGKTFEAEEKAEPKHTDIKALEAIWKLKVSEAEVQEWCGGGVRRCGPRS